MTDESQKSGKEKAAVARQRRSIYVSVAKNEHATIEELLEAVFSIWHVLAGREKNIRQKSRQDLKPRMTVLASASSNLTDRPTGSGSPELKPTLCFKNKEIKLKTELRKLEQALHMQFQQNTIL
jgi:hypothetical protein